MRFIVCLLCFLSVSLFAQDYSLSISSNQVSDDMIFELSIENISGGTDYAFYHSTYSIDFDTATLDLSTLSITNQGYWSNENQPGIFEDVTFSIIQDTIVEFVITTDLSQLNQSIPSGAGIDNGETTSLFTFTIGLKDCASTTNFQYVDERDIKYLWDGVGNNIDQMASYDDVSLRSVAVETFKIDLVSHSNASICYGDTLFLDVDTDIVGLSPYKFTWDIDAGSKAESFTNNDTAWVKPYNEGDSWVKISVEDANGCLSIDSVKVFTRDSISISFSEDTSYICPYAPISLEASVTGGSSVYEYSWGVDSSKVELFSAIEDNTLLENEFKVFVKGSGHITLNVMDNLGCSIWDSSLVLSVVLGVEAVTEHVLVCPDYQLDLTVIVSDEIDDDYNYFWFGDDFITSTNEKDVSIQPVTSRWYSIYVDGKCDALDSVFVEVQPIEAVIASNPYYVCLDDTIVLDGSGSYGTVEFNEGQTHIFDWEFLDQVDGVFISNSDTLESSRITRDQAGLGSSSQVSLTITDSIGCTDTKSTTVIWNTEVEVEAIEDTFYVCLDDTTIAGANSIGGQGSYQYEWFAINGSITILNDKTASPSFVTNDSALVVVKSTDLVGCVGFDTVIVLGGLDFVIDVLASDDLICPGASSTLNVQVTEDFVGGFSFVWDTLSATTESLLITPLYTDLISVEVLDFRTGCKAKDTITIIIDGLDAQISAFDDELCFNENVVSINSNSTTGGVGVFDYEWSINNNDILLSNETTSEVTLTDNGVFRLSSVRVVLKITDEENCESFDTSFVNWYDQITIDFLDNGFACTGNKKAIDVDVLGGSGTYNYTWSTTSGLTEQSRIDSSSVIIDANIEESNEKVYLSIIDDAGCSQIDSTELFTKNLQAVFSSDADTICTNQTVQFELGSIAGNVNSSLSLLWDGLNPENIFVKDYTIQDDTTVFVKLIDDVSACFKNYSLDVIVKELDANISQDRTKICFEDSVLLSAMNTSGGTAPYTYVWSSIEELSFGTSGVDVTVIPEAHDINSGTRYVLSATDEKGCTDKDTSTIYRNDSISIQFIGNTVYCVGLEDTVNTVVSGGDGVYSYSWSVLSSNTIVDPVFLDRDSIVVNSDLAVNTQMRLVISDGESCVDTAFYASQTFDLKVEVASDLNNICEGRDVEVYVSSLVNNLGDNLTYSWNSAVPSNDSTFTISLQKDTTITVAVLDDSTSCSRTASIDLNVSNPVIDFNVGDVSWICNEDSILISANVTGAQVPITYSWSSSDVLPAIINQNELKVQPSNSDTSIYVISIIDNNGCQLKDSVAVIRNSELNLDFTSSAYSCVSEEDSIFTTVSGGEGKYTYAWTSLTGLSTFLQEDDTLIFNNSQAQVSEFELTVTDSLGCQVVDTVTTESIDLTVALSADVNDVCANTRIAVLAQVSNSKTNSLQYSWDGGTSFVSADSLVVFPQFDTTVTVEVYDDSVMCSTTSNIVINVTELNFDITNSPIFTCYADSVTMEVQNITGANGAITYAWSTDVYQLSSQTDTTGTQIKVLPLSTGIADTTYYKVSVSDAVGCLGLDSVGVVRNSELLVAVDSKQYTCINDVDTVKSIVTSDYSNPTFEWSVSNNGAVLSSIDSVALIYQIDDQNIASIVIQLTVTDSLGCQSSSSEIISLSNPSFDLISDVNSICSGSEVLFEILNESGIQSTASYTFDNINFSTAKNTQFTISNDSTITASLKDDLTGCIATSSKSIVVEELQIVIDGLTEYCFGSNAYFDLSNTTGGTGVYSISSTITDAVKESGDDYEYNLSFDNVLDSAQLDVVFVDTKGCQDNASVSFVQNAEMNAFAGNDDTLCFSSGKKFLTGATASGGTGAYSYYWSSNAFGVLSNTTTLFPELTFDENLGKFVYEIVFTARDQSFTSCTVTDEVLITVGENPKLQALDTLTICPEDTIYLKPVDDSLNIYNVTWIDEVLTQDSLKVSDAGVYKFLIVNSESGCTTPIDSTVVEEYLLPKISATSDFEYACPGIPVQISATLTDTTENGMFYWTYPDNILMSDLDSSLLTNQFELLNFIEDTAFVVAHFVNMCNDYTDTLVYALREKPEVDLSISDSVILITYEVDYTVEFYNPYSERKLEIDWTLFVDDTKLQLTTSDDQHHRYLLEGNYTSQIQVLDTVTQCYATDAVYLEVRDDKLLYVPNVFSPSSSNADNSTLKVFGANVDNAEFLFRVYNRWGELIYETSSFYTARNDGWNGIHQGTGQEQSVGVYTYTLAGKYLDGKSFEQTGTVTLIR